MEFNVHKVFSVVKSFLAFFSQGVVKVARTGVFWKRAYSLSFLIMFYCIFASITHRCVSIDVLLLTENDVIEKHPPGGTRIKF